MGQIASSDGTHASPNPRGGTPRAGASAGEGAPGPSGAVPRGEITPGQTAAEQAMRTANPSLYALAARYFPGQANASAPRRLFRLTRIQLDATTRALLPAHHMTKVAEVLPADPLQTNYELADNLGISAAAFTPYVKWVEQLAASVRARPDTVIACTAAPGATGTTGATCPTTGARAFVTRAFRGAATAATIARFVDFFSTSLGQVGLADATADLVALVLTSPGYLFRDEVTTDAAGLLAPPQRLQALTYTLADAPPEALGLSSLSPGPALEGPEALRKTIDGILATPEARAKLRRFLLAWLEVREPDEFGIAPSVFPAFTPAVAAAAVEETTRFLDHQLGKPAPRLSDVTHATQAFVSPALAPLYDLASAPPMGLVDLDPSRRIGIFTQPAVIASHSGPTTTRLVKRGVFFTRKVMCVALGAPPPGLDTNLPESSGSTQRQQIESGTRAPACAGCHAYINPFGFMQENYDAIGRWRTSEARQPIDASIALDLLDEGPLRTSSPVEALRRLLGSAMCKQCFVRQLFRFYLGREERSSDDPLLRKLFFDLAAPNEPPLPSLLQGLGASSALSHRAEVR